MAAFVVIQNAHSAEQISLLCSGVSYMFNSTDVSQFCFNSDLGTSIGSFKS